MSGRIGCPAGLSRSRADSLAAGHRLTTSTARNRPAGFMHRSRKLDPEYDDPPPSDDDDDPGWDWDEHPSLTAAERNPSLCHG